MPFANGTRLIFAVAVVVVLPTALLVTRGRSDGHPSPTVIWIDTDPSVMPGGHEVDDGLALIQAFHSSEVLVRGISVVFGNAELREAVPIAEQIMEQFGPKNLHPYPGAARAEQLGVETPASRALASALQKEALTIVALGPMTNIATVLQQHPELEAQMIRIVAVAGRRPNQHFTTGANGIKPFKDFNFELDPKAFQALLASKIPLTLAPWELSSQVWITAADLDQLWADHAELEWLYQSAVDWLARWQERFGVLGFNPFDTLAVGIVIADGSVRCQQLPVEIRILLDDSPPAGQTADVKKPYLLVSQDFQTPRLVEYCFQVKPEFKDDLLRRLQRPKRQSEAS